ncbi:bifunctional 2-methylcitrate synthase/citrate synthase [Skermania sp. ID1734]|uniref:bifunctional 2-methylcitrate synthase/citrate synthase n=1 Tax=Skermania sp. ID1734 TaxID=2597516 RepID=UPI0011801E48|nr:bifunctional 2-methylcitrate synthase/citrate synthase [Skermania sp. ID1734]TSE00353.1 bifunctional 2-methylcitrate synthase/citrate synthase [Skermania sp. ID1734]
MTDIKKGLDGVFVDTTAISDVVSDTNSLIYRGYPVGELAESCSFEEVAYLLWYGELPSASELSAFTDRERGLRRADDALLSMVTSLPENCDPMDVLRTAVSYLGATDPNENDNSRDANLAKALRITAVIPTVIAADLRRRRGQDLIPPSDQLGFAENFLTMCFGAADPKLTKAFQVSLILYAEHSFNASTFAARVVASTMSDIYSAVTAAIGALKGPLHGGANEAVMRDMLDIGDAANVDEWLRGKLDAHDKVMGFGHRVYKHGDSRVPTMKSALDAVAAATDGDKWLEIYSALETAMEAETGLKPNLDFPAGPAYYLMGFDIEEFTPIFVSSRVTGWTAHIIEQLGANALIRPLAEYSGPEQRSVPTTPTPRA